MSFTKNKQFAILKKTGVTVAEVEFDKLNGQGLYESGNIMKGELNGNSVALKRFDSERDLKELLQLRLEHTNVVKFL